MLVALVGALGTPLAFAYIWWRIASHRKNAGKGFIARHLLGVLVAWWIAPFYLGGMALLTSPAQIWGAITFLVLFAIQFAAVRKYTPLAKWEKKQPKSKPAIAAAPARPVQVIPVQPVTIRPVRLKQFTSAADNIDDVIDDLLHGDPATSVEFSYRNEEGQRSRRRVDVHTVAEEYFEGYCHQRKRNRTFRFDRIQGGRVTDTDTGEILPVRDWQRALQAAL